MYSPPPLVPNIKEKPYFRQEHHFSVTRLKTILTCRKLTSSGVSLAQARLETWEPVSTRCTHCPVFSKTEYSDWLYHHQHAKSPWCCGDQATAAKWKVLICQMHTKLHPLNHQVTLYRPELSHLAFLSSTPVVWFPTPPLPASKPMLGAQTSLLFICIHESRHKLHGFSPWVNHTDRGTALCWRS
jgi:hypothetical protein